MESNLPFSFSLFQSLILETFRLKELFVESNAFYARGVTKQTANDACERVASCLTRDLGIKRWKDFSHISETDLTDLAGISAEESVQVSELVQFSREVNIASLKFQMEQVREAMESVAKQHAELLKNMTLFQNFVTVGVPLDASLNELANLKTKMMDQRDQLIRDLHGPRAAAGESIEEDSATHALRSKSIVLSPHVAPNLSSTASSSSNSSHHHQLAAIQPPGTSLYLWKLEPTVDTTSFRQQLRSLHLNTATTKLFRKCFVDPNIQYICFVAERRSSAGMSGAIFGGNASNSGSNASIFGTSPNQNHALSAPASRRDSFEDSGSEHVESMIITFEKKKISEKHEKAEKNGEKSGSADSPRITSDPDLASHSLMLIQSTSEDVLLKYPATGKAKDMLDVLLKTSQLAEYEIFQVSENSREIFTKQLLALETKLATSNYKMGVLYVRPGQTREEEYLSNVSGSREYEQFLKMLGDKIALKGWQNFTAGLDTRDNRNGTHSIFATLDQVSVMFHVATMMPFEKETSHQQGDEEEYRIERKRHIGNDVVCIVFVDDGATFNPASMRTEFIHVYVVVQPTVVNNKLYYKIEVAYKDGVAKFTPLLPNCLFPQSKHFSAYLLTKLINADIAASDAPVFKKRIMRTREALIGDLVSQAKSNKWTKKGASATAPSAASMTSSAIASTLSLPIPPIQGISSTSSSCDKGDKHERNSHTPSLGSALGSTSTSTSAASSREIKDHSPRDRGDRGSDSGHSPKNSDSGLFPPRGSSREGRELVHRKSADARDTERSSHSRDKDVSRGESSSAATTTSHRPERGELVKEHSSKSVGPRAGARLMKSALENSDPSSTPSTGTPTSQTSSSSGSGLSSSQKPDLRKSMTSGQSSSNSLSTGASQSSSKASSSSLLSSEGGKTHSSRSIKAPKDREMSKDTNFSGPTKEKASTPSASSPLSPLTLEEKERRPKKSLAPRTGSRDDLEIKPSKKKL